MTEPDATQPPTGAATADAPTDAPTGADAAAQLLETIDERPLHEHPDAYDRIHAALHTALGSIDDA